MDGQHLKKSKIFFIHEFMGPNGPIPLGYTKKNISIVLSNILKNNDNEPSTTYVSNPTTPFEYKKEHPLLVDSLIEKNKNFNWFHIKNFDDIRELNKINKHDYFICFFESNGVSDMFDFYSDSVVELDEYFSPKLLEFIKNSPNFKIVFFDGREGAYPHSMKLIYKINQFIKKHQINQGDNKFIISSNNDLITKMKDGNEELFKGIRLYNNNYNIFIAGRFILELQHKNNVIVENNYNFSIQDELNLDKKEKYFLMYNRNTSRVHRPWFVYNLYKNDLLKHGLVSLMQVDDYDEFIKKDGNFDELGLTVTDINFLRENTPNFYPLWIDESDGERVSNFHNFLSRKDEYEKTFFTIVSETSASDNYRFLTEKTVKPIMNYHPFLILGNPGSIQQLKDLGFKTFSDYWDESYDGELNFKKRTEMILNEVKILTEKSFEEWKTMLVDMEPILRHNKNLLIKMERYKKFPIEMIENITNEK
jgi:hypothetical protein